MLNIKEMTEKFDDLLSKYTKEELKNFLVMLEERKQQNNPEPEIQILYNDGDSHLIINALLKELMDFEPEIKLEKNQVFVSYKELDDFVTETTIKVVVNIPTKPLYVKADDECLVGIFPCFYKKQDPELVTHLKFLRFSKRDNKLDVLSADTYVSGDNFSDLINYNGNSDVKTHRIFSIKYAIFVMMYIEDHHFVTKEEFVKHLDIAKNNLLTFYYQM